MRKRRIIGLCALLLVLSSQASAIYTLTPTEQKVLASWLAAHPQFRAATDLDCDCSEDIKQMRTVSDGVWKAVPDYHPYSVSGDLNGDGALDFAVVVVERSSSVKKATLLVFNGPLRTSDARPSFSASDLDLLGKGIFFGPPRPKPYRLVVGGFETDNTNLLIPKGRSYKLQ